MLEATARSDIAYHPVCPPIPVGSHACGTGVDGCLSTPSPYDAIQALVGRSATSTTQKGSKRPLLLNTDREIEVPAAYDGLLALPAEQADGGGGEREQCPCLRLEPDPARGEDAQQVPVRERDGVSAGVARAGDHPVSTRSHLRRTLASRAAVPPQRPARPHR